MKEFTKFPVGRITRHAEEEGECLEERLKKMTEGNEPINLGATINYTDRKDGVHAEYDIRTDRFEIAMQAMNKAHATNYAQRMEADGFVKNDKGEWEPGPESPNA